MNDQIYTSCYIKGLFDKKYHIAMDSKGRLLFSSFIASILILGSLGFVQQSYAQVSASTSVDLNPPTFTSDDCAVGFQYVQGPAILLRGGECLGFSLIGDPTQDCPQNNVVPSETNTFNECHFFVPNFDDPFNTKLIRIQVVYGQSVSQPPPQVRVEPSSGNCILDQRFDEPNRYFFEDWICHPNPIGEQVWINFGLDTELFEVLVDTVSFGSTAVGGEFIPIDATAIVLAGSQTTAAWMIPVIVSGIGFAVVIARKF